MEPYIRTFTDHTGLYAGFTTKHAGDLRSDELLHLFLKKQGISYRFIVRPRQVHGDHVRVLSASELSNQTEMVRISHCDGIISCIPNVVLAVITGDCVPLIFADTRLGIIGVSHQGWKGTARRMAQKMLRRMQLLGSQIEDIHVSIGPCIGIAHYNIPSDRYELFVQEFPDYADQCVRFIPNTGDSFLDLGLLNWYQLQEVGMPADNVHNLQICTYERRDLFYSFRRDTKEEFGEMVSFIVKTDK